MLKTSQIQMRDPYIFVQNGTYYLYGTTDKDCWKGDPDGFNAYKSNDLKNWEGPYKIFGPSNDFWGTQNFWAPEIHYYKGNYYLLASFKSPDKMRATSILKSDSPLGPFEPWGDESVTPDSDKCLDGTLYVDSDDVPWIVYCHEWNQEGGGTICARKLKDDLSGAIGDSTILFAAIDAKWTRELSHSSGIKGYVTDGPNVYSPKNGELWIIWSSFTDTGYALGLAVSSSGNILGKWEHRDEAIFSADGGHGMLFNDLSGKMHLTLHTPNDTPNERPIFIPIKETNSGFELIK